VSQPVRRSPACHRSAARLRFTERLTDAARFGIPALEPAGPLASFDQTEHAADCLDRRPAS
jgi:hypothetical protein